MIFYFLFLLRKRKTFIRKTFFIEYLNICVIGFETLFHCNVGWYGWEELENMIFKVKSSSNRGGIFWRFSTLGWFLSPSSNLKGFWWLTTSWAASMSMNLETKFKTILCLIFQHTYLFYLYFIYIITLNIHLIILNRKLFII